MKNFGSYGTNKKRRFNCKKYLIMKRRKGLIWITWSEPNIESGSTIGGQKYFYEPLWYFLLRKIKP